MEKSIQRGCTAGSCAGSLGATVGAALQGSRHLGLGIAGA